MQLAGTCTPQGQVWHAARRPARQSNPTQHTSQPLAGAAYSRLSRRASGISFATQLAGQHTERSRLSRACTDAEAGEAAHASQHRRIGAARQHTGRSKLSRECSKLHNSTTEKPSICLIASAPARHPVALCSTLVYQAPGEGHTAHLTTLQHALPPPGGKRAAPNAVHKHNVQKRGVCKRQVAPTMVVTMLRIVSSWERFGIIVEAGLDARATSAHKAAARRSTFRSTMVSSHPPEASAAMPSRASTSWWGARGSNRCTPSCVEQATEGWRHAFSSRRVCQAAPSTSTSAACMPGVGHHTQAQGHIRFIDESMETVSSFRRSVHPPA